MAYWWVAPLVAGAVKTGIDAYTGYQKGKAQQSKIDDLSKITPEERDYVKRQRGIAEGGDPMIDQMYNQQRGRVIGDIRQGGAEARNLAVGQAVSQGLENSIISQELRRKADTSTLKQIGDASQRIAEANMRAQIGAKQSAQGSLDRFQLNRAQMLRNLGMQRPTDAGINAEAFGTVAGGLVDMASIYANQASATQSHTRAMELKGYQWDEVSKSWKKLNGSNVSGGDIIL